MYTYVYHTEIYFSTSMQQFKLCILRIACGKFFSDTQGVLLADRQRWILDVNISVNRNRLLSCLRYTVRTAVHLHWNPRLFIVSVQLDTLFCTCVNCGLYFNSIIIILFCYSTIKYLRLYQTYILNIRLLFLVLEKGCS